MTTIPRHVLLSPRLRSLVKLLLLCAGIVIDWSISVPVVLIVGSVSFWQKERVNNLFLLGIFLLSILYDTFFGWWLGANFLFIGGWYLGFRVGHHWAIHHFFLTASLTVCTTIGVQVLTTGMIQLPTLVFACGLFLILQSISQRLVHFYSTSTA